MIMAVIMMVLVMVVRKIEIRNQAERGIIVMNMKTSNWKILMILSVVFFYLPILYMIIFSFNDGKSLTS